MKKRYILLAGMCVIGMLAVGCGSKETTVEVTPTPTPTIEVSGKSNMVEMQQSVGIDKTKITKIYKLQVSRINSTSFSWRLSIESLSHISPFANSFISLCCAIGDFS